MELNARQKAAYGAGAVGKDMVYSLVAGFLLFYFNDVLGISGTFIGFMFMFARVFDAFNDPLMGIVVEKTHTRFGKFRPWIFIGTITNAIILVFMFHMPAAFSKGQMMVFATVTYLIWGVTYTLMDIPYWSMIPAITKSGKERENLSVIARSCAGFGYAIPTALTMALVKPLGGGDQRIGFSRFALIVAAVFVIAELICVFNVKEPSLEKMKSPTIKELFLALIHNDQALIMVVSIIIFNTSLYITNQLAVYFFKYDIGNESLFGIFGIVGGVAQIAAMLMLPAIRKKLETVKIFYLALATAIGGYLFLFLLGTFHVTNMIFLCLAAVIIFIGFGLATVLTTIFLADTVDYGEYKTGQRNESVIFSLQTFVVKLASGLSVLIVGIGIDLLDFDKTAAVQTADTLLKMRVLMTIVPIIGLLLTIFIFVRKYKLGETKLKEISAALNSRRGKE